MHVAACLWLLPLLATVFYVFTKLHDTSSTSRHVLIPIPCRASTPERSIFRFMDYHLSITSILKHFANAIEYEINSLHTRTALKMQANINHYHQTQPCAIHSHVLDFRIKGITGYTTNAGRYDERHHCLEHRG